jgi:hypothetical protein
MEPIGYIPPAEAEERYYATLNEQKLAAWLKPNSLRQTRGGSDGNPAYHQSGQRPRSVGAATRYGASRSAAAACIVPVGQS